MFISSSLSSLSFTSSTFATFDSLLLKRALQEEEEWLERRHLKQSFLAIHSAQVTSVSRGVAKLGSGRTGRKGGLISPPSNDSVSLILLILEENGFGVPFVNGFGGRVHPVDAAGEGRVDASCEIADEGVVIGEPA